MYSVVLSRESDRFFQRGDKITARKLSRCFQTLEGNPRGGNNVKALKGKLAGAYRYRIGDFRVVYTIDDAHSIVFVIMIASRGSVYE